MMKMKLIPIYTIVSVLASVGLAQAQYTDAIDAALSSLPYVFLASALVIGLFFVITKSFKK